MSFRSKNVILQMIGQVLALTAARSIHGRNGIANPRRKGPGRRRYRSSLSTAHPPGYKLKKYLSKRGKGGSTGLKWYA